MITINRSRFLTDRTISPPVDNLHVISTDPEDEGEAPKSTVIDIIFDKDIILGTLTPLTFIVEMDDLLLLESTSPVADEEDVKVGDTIQLRFNQDIDEETVSDETILVEMEEEE